MDTLQTAFEGMIFDRCSFGASKREKTPEGYLVVKDNKLARPGVLFYQGGEIGHSDPDALVRVYRAPAELFKPEVVKTFQSKPVTQRHRGLINATNARDAAVGMAKDDWRPDGGFLVGSLVVTDADAIKAIEDGETAELSLGYTAKFHACPGITPDGEAYDYLMTSIVGNHVALVERGRNGRECRVSDSETQKQGIAMETTTIVLDGVSYTVPVQAAQLVEKLQKQVSEVKTASEKIVADHAAECDTLQAKIDAALASVPTQDAIDRQVVERVSLIDSARKVVADYDGSGKTAHQIRTEVCTAKGVAVADKSPEYIQARFDILIEDAGKLATREALKVEDKATGIPEGKSASEVAREKRMHKEAK